ncbi:peptide ABC transporter substrate-binding protein [Agrobacterium tumefaciens]|uniref:ABC transporter substrate-binding protein n=1 Tax=Agrobacterium tumefaciens TaxID=358 RepID=UPI0012B97711|nr:ABC transporter substrate-binding protein [Agrobacterium tumefaciens]MQB08029.1 peptide ABC transporter substrate-binding protein [Agrobacterium tumefaciens]
MKKYLSIAALALSAALLATTARAASDLYFGLSNEPANMAPEINVGTQARMVRFAIHRGLMNYDVTGKLAAELASDYEISPDGKQYTFRLRDAKFHDGSPVTSEDVKATFEKIIGPNSKATYKGELSIIDRIETPDAKTVRFVLKSTYSPFIHYLALPESVIVPNKWLEAYATNPNVPPVGAGPFKFVNWSRGQEIVVEKFADYYKKGKPTLDSIHFSFLSDDNTRVNALRSNDVDMIEFAPWKDMDTIRADPNLGLATTTGPFMVLQFNTRFEPFSKPEVRQALAYGIDRNVIIKTAFNGQGTPLFGMPIPKGYPGYTPEFEHFFSYDVAKAKDLLAKAGYPNGFKARLLSTAQFAFHSNTAVAVKGELAKLGIEVELELPDWAGRNAKATEGNYDLIVSGTSGDITDPDWLSNFFYGGNQLVRLNNSPYFNDPQINALLDKGKTTVDAGAREQIYKDFSKRALELSPFVYLMWRDQSYGVNKKVKGFTNMPGFLSFHSGLSLENVSIAE